jgi:hypothetical protein
LARGSDRLNPMDDPAEPFRDHVEVHEYAERNGLDYAWAGTALFEKRRRTLPADQFEVREVRTRKGITTVGLFSKAIAWAEWEADAPNRKRLAKVRLARMARIERHAARSKARRKG